jgi:hypothetical protein
MKSIKNTIVIAFLLLLSVFVWATNIQITQAPMIVNRDIPGHKITVRFSLSWDNSWNLNSPPNHDAAWVFLKYRALGSDGFKHCNLYQADSVVKGPGSDGCIQEYGESPVPNGHDVTTGVFLRRAQKSIGTTTFNDVELEWDITGTGIDSATSVSIGVYAIEMVYVPVGEVLSSNVVAADVNTKWPNGSSPFYIMKHEVTQAAWVDFLNTLDYQQQSRLANVSGANLALPVGTPLLPLNSRMMVKIRVPSSSPSTPAIFGVSQNGTNWDLESNGGNLPMFNLSWTDITAYLDWACLRPLTEMEYEKAARGNLPVVANELAWGNATVGTVAATISNPYRSDEVSGTDGSNRATPADANIAAHSAAVSARWPLRVGSFATDASTRVEAGSGYWGVLNLSDNVAERYVNYSQAAGKQFNGTYHGDGNILGSGLSDVLTWPGQASALATSTGADGTGYKGIGIAEGASTTIVAFSAASAGVSTRSYMSNRYNSREGWTGIRGGRTIFIPFSVLVEPAITRRASTAIGITGTGAVFSALSVKGVGGSTPYTYQWYVNTTPDTAGAEPIEGAINQTYTPLRDTAHVPFYYFCVIKDLEDSVQVTNMSGAHSVLGIEKHPATDVLQRYFYEDDNSFPVLTVIPTGGVTPYSYQWYYNTTAANTGGTQIAGATYSSYRPVMPKPNATYYFWCLVTDNRGQSVRTAVSGSHIYFDGAFDCTKTTQSITLAPGTYTIEAWGAVSGGGAAQLSAGSAMGNGGYTKGTLEVSSEQLLYIYVGGKGVYGANAAGGWNGGGKAGSGASGSGGGASDIRLVGGTWNDATSLRSRLMVAGGGGGSDNAGAGLGAGDDGSGGWGGGLNGGQPRINGALQGGTTYIGTQTSGYAFGYGGPGTATDTGGGGGGYYGGKTTGNNNGGAGGGSSFISGHSGCIAKNEDGTNRTDAIHYSGITFTNTVMTAGNASMPNARGTGNVTGNANNGFVRITRVK